MKKPSRILMITLVLLAGIGLTSCELFGSSDNPATPENPEQPEQPKRPKTYASIEHQPLTFEAVKSNITVMLKFKDDAKPDYKKVEYSFDGYTWTPLSSPAQPISLKNVGDIVMFQGTNPSYNGDAQFVIEQASGTRASGANSGIYHYLAVGSGNPCSLLGGVHPDGRYSTKLGSQNINAFMNLFGGTMLDLKTDEKGKILFQMPTVLAAGCCAGMFAGSAISALNLPAQELKADCYKYICEGCDNLKAIVMDALTCEGNLTLEDCAKGMLKDAGTSVEGGLKITLPEKVFTGNADFSVSEILNTTDYSGNVALMNDEGKETNVNIMTITLDVDELNLLINESKTLIANYTPTDAQLNMLEWRSNDPNVATVDEDGVVTAVGKGKTTIIVKPKYCGGGDIYATCTVTVTEPVTDPSVNDPDDYSDGGDPTASN